MTGALASAGVQFGTITVASGSTTGTASISAMGAGGFLLMDGFNASQAGGSLAQSSCTLSISGTTLTATRQTGGTNTVTMPFVAVDGDTTNLIQSVQHGSVSFVGGSSTGNATISAVTTGNTAVAHLGVLGTSTSVSLNLSWPVWALASSTAVSMTTNTSGGVITGRFCAIEFKSAALVSLQYATDTAAPSTTTRTKTISAVTLANTLSIYAGQWSSSTTSSSQQQYGQLTSTTQLTIGTNSAGFVSIAYAAFIVNLASALVETGAQRGLITQTAAASATAAISTVDVTHAILSYLGSKTNGSNWNVIANSLSLTSAILVTANAGASTTNSTSYEVIALNSSSTPDVTVNLTGVAGTGAAGTITAKADVDVALDGINSTASPGDIAIDLQQNVALTGVAATGSPGAIAPTGDANVTLTGAAATGSPGTITINLQLDVPLTGVQGDSAAGTLTAIVDVAPVLTGVAATGSAGAIAPTTDVSVSLTGAQGTSAAGDITVSLSNPVDVSVTLDGAAATGQAGTITPTIDVSVSLGGVQATGSPGAIAAVTDVQVSLTGAAATGSPGDIAPTGDAVVPITGAQATGSAGDIAVTADAIVALTGVQAAGAAGDITIDLTDSVQVPLTGVEAQGQAGDVAVTAERNETHKRLGGGPSRPWGTFEENEIRIRPEQFDRQKAIDDIQKKVLEDLRPKKEEPPAAPRSVAEIFVAPQKKKAKPLPKNLTPVKVPDAEELDDFVQKSVMAQHALDDMVVIALLM